MSSTHDLKPIPVKDRSERYDIAKISTTEREKRHKIALAIGDVVRDTYQKTLSDQETRAIAAIYLDTALEWPEIAGYLASHYPELPRLASTIKSYLERTIGAQKGEN